MTNPWHKNDVDMIRTNTALHLDLSPQEGRNASSFGICRDRNRIRLTTRWSEQGMLRYKQETIELRIPGKECAEASPGRSARSRYPAYLTPSQLLIGKETS